MARELFSYLVGSQVPAFKNLADTGKAIRLGGRRGH